MTTIILVTLVGGVAGFFYWKVFGCAFGICPLSQNKYVSTIVGALIGLMLITSSSCSAQTPDNQTTGNSTSITTGTINEEVAPEVFLSKIGTENTVLIDVRTPEEFATGHIPNALNINFNAPDFAAQMETLDKSKTYLIYCKSGVRSGKAAAGLSATGFNTIYTLKGGVLGWNQPLEK
jgi:phage shock protein E